jgi:hypothetical protein
MPLLSHRAERWFTDRGGTNITHLTQSPGQQSSWRGERVVIDGLRKEAETNRERFWPTEERLRRSSGICLLIRALKREAMIDD